MSGQTDRDTENTMADSQELAVHEKKELVSKEEKTSPGRYYTPYTDIYETDETLTVSMEMPGVENKAVEVVLDDGVLRVEGRIDFAKYEGMEPVYTEYNIGHYTRSFRISDKIDQANISAQLEEGVLTLKLPKVKEVQPRRIAIS
jgi:HSP20 family molecular chaperone IbpA